MKDMLDIRHLIVEHCGDECQGLYALRNWLVLRVVRVPSLSLRAGASSCESKRKSYV